MKKISIIIPIYKVEKYLSACIDSICNQTYKDLEIILVDDGSPDNCGQICDDYAQKDSRIRVIHKENAGVAMARNDGLDIATGDFISFVDSDDWLSENAYEKMMNAYEECGADCVIGGCQIVYEKEEELEFKSCSFPSAHTEDSIKTMRNLLLNQSAVWNRLFKSEIFSEIRFPQNRINDDEVVALHAYAKCKKVHYLDTPTYYYRIRANSITTSAFSLKKVDVFYNAQDNLEFIKNSFPELTEEAEYKYLKTMLYSCYYVKRLNTDEAKEKRKELKAKIKENKAKFKTNKYITFPYRILAFLLSIG